MTERLFSFLILLLGLVSPLSAREIYSDQGIPFAYQGDEYIDSVSNPHSAFDYHLRVAIPAKTSLAEWVVSLIYADAHCPIRQITLSRNGSPAESRDYGIPLHITYAQCRNASSCRKYRITQDVSPDIDEWSLVIRHMQGADSAICEIGQQQPLYSFSVPVSGLTYISTYSCSDLKLKRLSFFNPASTVVRYADLEDRTIEDHLAASDDVNEAVWRYLDQDTDPRRFVKGGDYRLATLRNPDGGYDIVYLDGARVSSSDWRPGRIKGRLLPTAFTNHFDLIWYDPYGRPVDTDTSADILDGSILRLNFPLHSSTIRLQK